MKYIKKNWIRKTYIDENGNTRYKPEFQKYKPKRPRITRGLTRTPEYDSWRAMKMRCTDKNYHHYQNYGGRGIKVCDRWLEENGIGFYNFLTDMGYRPEPKYDYSLDRIDNDGNYTPENCRWATKKQQLNNTRRNLKENQIQLIIEMLLKKKKMVVIARELNISLYQVIKIKNINFRKKAA